MGIYQDLTRLLADSQPRSLSELLPHFPQISHLKDGEAALRLLLRLCPQVRSLPDGRWTLAAVEPTAEQRIVAAVQAYFQKVGIPGELVGKLTRTISSETGYPESFTKSIILARFKNNAGRMIFNNLKES